MMGELEQIIFEIITYAGEGKGYAYEALYAAEKGEYDKVDGLFKQSDQAFLKAHKVQTNLIQKEAGGEKTEVSLLMVHAQDQLMSAMESRTLLERMVILHKKIDGKLD